MRPEQAVKSTSSVIRFAFAILLVLTGADRLRAQSSRPNVIVLLADDLGWQDIGCYGGPVKTPYLDRLAADGVRFTNFYSAAPVCSPARATLLTGRHHLRTGVYTVIQDHLHHTHLLKSEVTIAEILGDNGYDTVHLGKWHLGTPFRGWKKPWIDEHGFDEWFATDLNAAPSHRNPSNFWRNRKPVGPLEGYACQLVVDEAIRWLDQKRTPGKPFFLNLWFHEPHAPLAAPEKIVSRYGQPDDAAAIYSATIDNTDRAIGKLLDRLRESGSLENTIIFYTSDHGSYRHERNGGLKAGKGSLLEGGIRTPGIFYWPAGIDGGRTEETPAGAIDLLPTLCGLLSIDVPESPRLDGADLSPLLTGDRNRFTRHQPLSWHSPTSQPVIAMRDGRFSLVGWRKQEYPKDQESIHEVMEKMSEILEEHLGHALSSKELWHQCYNSRLDTPEWNRLRAQFVTLNTFQEAWIPLIKSGSGGMSRFELYDLKNDPGQTHDVAQQYPDVVRRMKESVLAVHQSVLEEAPVWEKPAPKEMELKIHRLHSEKRSHFDAFVYVNRIPVEAESGEPPEELSGRILGRLANQEGRILLKLPPGMDRKAYEGFKIALEGEDLPHSGRCFHCHHLPNLDQPGAKPPIPSLRNRSLSASQLKTILSEDSHSPLRLDQSDCERLHKWLLALHDVPDNAFRNLIIKATVLDTSGDLE